MSTELGTASTLIYSMMIREDERTLANLTTVYNQIQNELLARHKVDLVPGQVWKRKRGGDLYVVHTKAYGGVCVYSVTKKVTVRYVEDDFNPDDFEKLFDPRWEVHHSDMLDRYVTYDLRY